MISHDEGVLNDHELLLFPAFSLCRPLLLYDLNRSNILDLPSDSFPDFNFDDLEDDECLSEFRFHKRDLPLLAELYNGVNEPIIRDKSVCDCRQIKI